MGWDLCRSFLWPDRQEGVCGDQDLNAGTAVAHQDGKAKSKQVGGRRGKAGAAGHAPKRRKADQKQSPREQNASP